MERDTKEIFNIRSYNRCNYYVWENVLNGWSIFSTYNIPEERCEDFLKAKVLVYFNYCYGMLLNGQENIVKHGLYLTGMRKLVKLDNKYQAIFYLAVHCYIYYLSDSESDDCVPANIRKVAKDILYDEDVKCAFGTFLDMLAENPGWLDEDVFKQLHKFLNMIKDIPKEAIVEPKLMTDNDYVEIGLWRNTNGNRIGSF